MKISKKIIVSSLSTALGVSLIGAISGTVAWYQYNTAVRTSLIGTNVADTGILEISATNAADSWKANLYTSDYTFVGGRTNTNITPVTFYDGTNNLASNVALPANAYKKPDAAKNANAANPGSFANVFEAATAQYDYIQYSFYVRARTVDDATGGLVQKAEEVLLKDFTLEDVPDGNIVSGMRVHLNIDPDNNVETANTYMLLSLAGGTTNLYGKLDLDGDGADDKVGGYEWNANRNNDVIYGANEKTQSAIKASTKVDTVLFSTPASGAAKVTVTIWIEGFDKTVGGGSSAVWSGENTDGAQFHFGMTLGVAADAFED